MIRVTCDLTLFTGNTTSVDNKAKTALKSKKKKRTATASGRKTAVTKKSTATEGGAVCENVTIALLV